MRIARYFARGKDRCGIIEGSTVHDVDWSLRDLLVLAAAGRLGVVQPSGASRDLADVDLLAPVHPEGRGVFCIGLNYLEHQRESADVFMADVPEHPVVFFKQPASLAGQGDVLPLPQSLSTQWDWEVELGVVIGAPISNAGPDQVWDSIAGYTIVNDVTARDLQSRHTQWFLGKNAAAATPVGPWIVSRDELGTPPDVELSLTVNGERKQLGRSSELIFDIPTLIATISSVTPLLPGDVIATGTPSGVGMKQNPPQFLTPGDEVVALIENIGALRNPVGLPEAASTFVAAAAS